MTVMPESVVSARALPLSLYPSLNPFARALVEGDATAARFVTRRDLTALSSSNARRNADELVRELAASNSAWGNEVDGPLQQWLNGSTLTLIAGQQVGFAGGPFYTLAKIASLLRLRARLEAAGKKATVFFWLATEDHDFDEVSTLQLWCRDHHERLRANERPTKAFPVGSLAIPTSLRREFQELTATSFDWLAEGMTFRDSFARLLAEVLRGYDVVLVDSLLPSLRRAGASLFRALLERHADVQAALTKRTDEIRAAGFAPQLTPSESGDYPLLYWLDDAGERSAIRKAANGWSVGDEAIAEADLLARIDSSPHRISTGVVARPLLQDLVFGSDIFVGGPAEVTYYAQLQVLHELFAIPSPHVALRGHALVAPQKVLRALDQYSIPLQSIFEPVDRVLQGKETAAIAEMRRTLEQGAAQLESTVQQVSATLDGLDSSTARGARRSAAHIAYHFQRLIEKTSRAIARRDAERAHAVQRLLELLAPGSVPQDRVTGWVTFWLTYRASLLQRLIEEIEPDQPLLKIIGL